jgi:nanoRNase/pAp phosphatase (c-di-AMP/oligoRNAs hydrolase)
VLIKEHLKHNCIIFNITGKVGDKYKVSIRVSEHCALNASDIAKQYGGGGHPKAAGCLMSEEQLQNL